MQEKKRVQRIMKKPVRSIQKTELEGISSINNLVALKRCGIYRLDVVFDGQESAELLMKTKSDNVVKNGINLVSGKDLRLMKELVLHRRILGYNQSYLREDAIYQSIDPALKKRMIRYYGCYTDHKNKTRNLLFQYYPWANEKGLEEPQLREILAGILPFHVRYMGRKEEAEALQLNIYESRDYRKARNCLRRMFDYRETENRRFYGEERIRDIYRFIDHIHEEQERYGAFKTFTHNDFSSRNLYLTPEGPLFYDFELACYQIPEHDVAELLIYESGALADAAIQQLLRFYYQLLREESPYDLSEQEYRDRLNYCVMEFVVNRLSLLRIVSDSIPIDFIETLLVNSNRLMDLL